MDFDINNTYSYPLILLRYSEFAKYIYDSEFKSLFQNHIPAMLLLHHSLISYIQQHFQAVTPIATKLKNLRSTLAGEPLSHKAFQDSERLFPRIMDILRRCVISDNMGMLSNQPSTYLIFHPSTTPKRKTERTSEEPAPKKARSTTAPPSDTTTSRSNGYLNNSSADKKLPPHTRLTINPCYQKLTTGDCTYPGCRLFHGVFPKDYSVPDRLVMCKWVKDTPCLTWKSPAQQALDRLEASS